MNEDDRQQTGSDPSASGPEPGTEVLAILGQALTSLDVGRPEAAAAGIRMALAILDPDAAKATDETLDPDDLASGPPQGLENLKDSELDRAFEIAAPDRDAMFDINDVAAGVLRKTGLDAPEENGDRTADIPFQTRTVAGLLAEQGHSDEAQLMRTQLEPGDLEPGLAPRSPVITTLERWLETLRREAR